MSMVFHGAAAVLVIVNLITINYLLRKHVEALMAMS